MKKHIFTLLLAFLLLTPTMISCSSGGKETEANQTAADTTETTAETDDNPAQAEEILVETNDTAETDDTAEMPDEEGTYTDEKAALAAALDGRFAAYCRSIGAFPGKMVDRINEIFMDETGDIVLDADYTVIPEYREEAEEWSKS